MSDLVMFLGIATTSSLGSGSIDAPDFVGRHVPGCEFRDVDELYHRWLFGRGAPCLCQADVTCEDLSRAGGPLRLGVWDSHCAERAMSDIRDALERAFGDRLVWVTRRAASLHLRDIESKEEVRALVAELGARVTEYPYRPRELVVICSDAAPSTIKASAFAGMDGGA